MWQYLDRKREEVFEQWIFRQLINIEFATKGILQEGEKHYKQHKKSCSNINDRSINHL